MKKIIVYIIAGLIIALTAYVAGLHSGAVAEKQHCFDTVAENCEYICGVNGDNFYYPDEEDQSFDHYEEDNVIAMFN